MFKLTANPTFKTKVSLTVAGQDQPEIIEVEFKHKTKAALAEWLKRSDSEDPALLLGEVIAGWTGMQDEDGISAFSPAALEVLLQNHLASGGELIRSYIKGLTESRAKN